MSAGAEVRYSRKIINIIKKIMIFESQWFGRWGVFGANDERRWA